MRKIIPALLLLVCPQIAQARDASWKESPQVYRPGSAPRGEHEVKVGETIVRLPVLWDKSARIKASAFFGPQAAQGRQLPPEAQLPQVLLQESPIEYRYRELYCTRVNIDAKRRHDMLTSVFYRMYWAGDDNQSCFEDTDKDGKFDRVVEVGKTKAGFRLGPAIDPVPYDRLNFEPISEATDYVEFTLEGVTAGRASIRMNIYRAGKRLKFKSVSSGQIFGEAVTRIDHAGGAPKRVYIFGLVLDIKGIDPQTGTVKIAVPDDAPVDTVVTIPMDISRLTFYAY